MFCSHRKVEGILLWGFHSKRHFKGQDAVLVGPDNKVGFIKELRKEVKLLTTKIAR